MMRRYWEIERYYISLVLLPAVDLESHRTELGYYEEIESQGGARIVGHIRSKTWNRCATSSAHQPSTPNLEQPPWRVEWEMHDATNFGLYPRCELEMSARIATFRETLHAAPTSRPCKA